MNATAEPDSKEQHRGPVGTLAIRLRRIYVLLVVLASFQLTATLGGFGVLMQKSTELEAAQHYARLAVQLKSDLSHVALLSSEVLYAGKISLIPQVLAVNESILLDFEALLTLPEVERHIQPSHTTLENRAIIMSLRARLVQSMVLARSGQKRVAQDHFRQGPRFYLEMAQGYMNDTVEAASEHIDDHRRQLDRLKPLLAGLLLTLSLGLLALLYALFRRLSRATSNLEADLEKALNRAAKQQRLAALGQIAGSISHELRNPLGTIRTSVFSLGDKLGGENPGVAKILSRIERSVVRCDRIINSLLDFGRQPQLEKTATNLKAWLQGVLPQLEVPPGITVSAALEDIGELELDREALLRAIGNVYSNACQAMTESEAARNETLHISLRDEGQRIAIEFKDTGCGIAPEHLEQVFEPLFSTRAFGVGLGMPIVKQVMENQGGGVEVRSEQGTGTWVTLWLPADTTGRRSERYENTHSG